MIQAVFFDFNGVIIDDEPLQLKVYQSVLGGEGVALTEADYYSALGTDDVAFVRAAFERVGKELNEETQARLLDAKTAAHRELLKGELPLFPGVVTLIKALARRYPLGLVSMARRTEIDYVLERASLGGYFAVIISAEGARAHKPDPSCYNNALESLNARRSQAHVLPISPEECLVIEDAPPGIRAGLAAGMRTLGVTNTVSESELRDAGAHVVTHNLADWTPDAVRHVFDTTREKTDADSTKVALKPHSATLFMTPADKIAAAKIRSQFSSEALKPDRWVNLDRAALLIGAEEEPRACDVERCVARLDEMGEEARARAGREGGSRVEALNRYLFEEQGFAGNESNYYDPRNSMLHRVLERRTGIPITLSILYALVGRRAGLRVEGVGLPGHFIVRASEADGDEVLVDPFHGKVTDEEECRQRLDVIYDGKITLGEEHLRAVGARATLVRVLGNLKAVYVQGQNFRRALAAVERILLLDPHDLTERRDRGVLLARLNHLSEAIAETRNYLSLASDAPDAEAVREQLKKMRIRQAMLN